MPGRAHGEMFRQALRHAARHERDPARFRKRDRDRREEGRPKFRCVATAPGRLRKMIDAIGMRCFIGRAHRDRRANGGRRGRFVARDDTALSETAGQRMFIVCNENEYVFDKRALQNAGKLVFRRIDRKVESPRPQIRREVPSQRMKVERNAGCRGGQIREHGQHVRNQGVVQPPDVVGALQPLRQETVAFRKCGVRPENPFDLGRQRLHALRRVHVMVAPNEELVVEKLSERPQHAACLRKRATEALRRHAERAGSVEFGKQSKRFRIGKLIGMKHRGEAPREVGSAVNSRREAEDGDV